MSLAKPGTTPIQVIHPPNFGSLQLGGTVAEMPVSASPEDKALGPEKSAGHVIVDTLRAHGIRRAYVVPGESFLDALDGLHGSPNWAPRYFPTQRYASMISARNGTMGYSVPSAIAASLAHPGRLIVTIAGDGEFLMNGQELAAATQYGATPLVIVMDNQEYGTIRTHQEIHYPPTRVRNPAEKPGLCPYGKGLRRVRDQSRTRS